MDLSTTNGLASYRQTVDQTPGLASYVYPESTSLELPLVVQIIPIIFPEKNQEPSQDEKTA